MIFFLKYKRSVEERESRKQAVANRDQKIFRFSAFSFQLLAFSFWLLIAACDSRPSGIINQEEMKMIIWDLEKAGQFVGNDTSAAVRLHLKDSTTAEFQKVLAVHKTTEEAFLKSLTYYEQNPEEFKTLIDSTTAMAGRIQVKIERQRNIKDSIRNKHMTDSLKIADSLKKIESLKDSAHQHKKNISPKK